MKASDAALRLIKQYEGFVAKAYYCPAGILTIGYGHTGTDVLPGMRVTQDQANDLLQKDVAKFEAIVTKAVTREITQGQFDALVSFCFNVGPGKTGAKDGLVTLKNGNPSSLLRLTNLGDKAGASAEFAKWTKANGIQLAGLVARREAERKLYLS